MSRAVLIGRALLFTTSLERDPCWRSTSRCAAPRARPRPPLTAECPLLVSDHGRGGTPGPIPNPEVKKLSPRAPMVLRSSPWESRTSLTNKGHFRVSGRSDGFAQLFAPRRLIGAADHCEALLYAIRPCLFHLVGQRLSDLCAGMGRGLESPSLRARNRDPAKGVIDSVLSPFPASASSCRTGLLGWVVPVARCVFWRCSRHRGA